MRVSPNTVCYFHTVCYFQLLGEGQFKYCMLFPYWLLFSNPVCYFHIVCYFQILYVISILYVIFKSCMLFPYCMLFSNTACYFHTVCYFQLLSVISIAASVNLTSSSGCISSLIMESSHLNCGLPIFLCVLGILLSMTM